MDEIKTQSLPNNNIELRKVEIEEQRLSLEQSRNEREKKFLNRHFGVIITAVISLAAVFVSLSQVWIAQIYKDKELKLSQINLEILKEEQERRYKLDLVKFISENRKLIFGKDLIEQKRIRDVMLVSFPSEITRVVFKNIEKTLPRVDGKDIWSEGIEIADNIALDNYLEKIKYSITGGSVSDIASIIIKVNKLEGVQVPRRFPATIKPVLECKECYRSRIEGRLMTIRTKSDFDMLSQEARYYYPYVIKGEIRLDEPGKFSILLQQHDYKQIFILDNNSALEGGEILDSIRDHYPYPRILVMFNN